VAQPLQLHAQYWNLQNETRAQRGYWKATDNQRKELKRIGEKLGVREVVSTSKGSLTLMLY